jgi:hypothetical protein
MELDSRKNESRTDMKRQDIVIEVCYPSTPCTVLDAKHMNIGTHE